MEAIIKFFAKIMDQFQGESNEQSQEVLHDALITAIRENNFKRVEQLLKKSTNFEVTNKPDTTYLFEALKHRRNTMARFLVKKDARRCGNMSLDNLSLHTIATFTSLMDRLFECGVKINDGSTRRRTALYAFIKTKCLIYGADVDKQSLAAFFGQLVAYGMGWREREPKGKSLGNLLIRFFEKSLRVHFNGHVDRIVDRIIEIGDTGRKQYIPNEVKTLIGLGFPANTMNCQYTKDDKSVFFRLEYSAFLKNYLGSQITESQIPTVLQTVALYRCYDQQAAYHQQRVRYLESISVNLYDDPDAYYKLALLCIYFPQRLVMHALEKTPYKANTISENLTLLYKVGRAYYWNTTVEITDTSQKQHDPLLTYVKQLPLPVLDFLVYSANTPASVEKTLAQLPRIKSKVLESTDSRNEFRKIMYADNYKRMANW